MSLLPRHIDPFLSARKEEVIEGEFLITDMQRLCERLLSFDGTVHFRLAFSRSVDNKPLIKGECKASLVFLCQRCNEPFEMEVNDQFALCPMMDDRGTNELPDAVEPLVTYGHPVHLLEMIEDEILLACPMIPKHAPKDCPVNLSDYLY